MPPIDYICGKFNDFIALNKFGIFKNFQSRNNAEQIKRVFISSAIKMYFFFKRASTTAVISACTFANGGNHNIINLSYFKCNACCI